MILFKVDTITMDDSGYRENGPYKADQFKPVHSQMSPQWMIPQHHMKDTQAIKLMAVIAERDALIQELNVALSEKKAALAERDIAILQKDAAIDERNAAVVARDSAFAALEYVRHTSGGPGCPPGAEQEHHLHLAHREPPQLADDPHNNPEAKWTRKDKKGKEVEPQSNPSIKKASRSRKGKTDDGGEAATPRKQQLDDGREEIGGSRSEHHRRAEFDELMIPVPVCSCTGKYRQCYKWGDGGWQSACCTPLLSVYPLPVMPDKRHARLGGRKMSGNAFKKLLGRLAAAGHDFSKPVDLKDHWARHGTNRYMTIK